MRSLEKEKVQVHKNQILNEEEFFEGKNVRRNKRKKNVFISNFLNFLSAAVLVFRRRDSDQLLKLGAEIGCVGISYLLCHFVNLHTAILQQGHGFFHAIPR